MNMVTNAFGRSAKPPVEQAGRLLDNLKVATKALDTPAWDAGDLHRSIRYLEMDSHTVGRWFGSQPEGATDGARLVATGAELAKVSRWLDDAIRSAAPTSDISADSRASFDRLLREPLGEATRLTIAAADAMG